MTGVERDEGSEDEEEIQTWLDNRGWFETSACRVLTLMDASGPPTPDPREEAAGFHTNTLTSAPHPPGGATPAQESDSFHATEDIMGDLKLLKLKCQEREQRAKEKKRILKMQLEEAIRGK